MKFKHFAGIMIVLAVGGYIAYKMICSKNDEGNDFDFEKEDDNSSVIKNELTEKSNDDVLDNEKQCDETMYHAYENMNVRNEQAKQILSDIHDDMKKSEDNISAKKEGIAKMMENLRK